jgi:hypothetical protein
MCSVARLLIVAVCCCVIASWTAQAQQPVQRAGDVSAGPDGPGISMKEGATGSLLGPAIGSASPPTGGSLNFPNQFTLSGIQSSVTLNDARSSSSFGGEGSSADKSCLTARAYTRPDIANKNMHQNWLSARNGCSHNVKISVCYRGSVSCISISIPPWQTKSAIIGYAPTASPTHYQISFEK